jgi:hypothetical protein
LSFSKHLIEYPFNIYIYPKYALAFKRSRYTPHDADMDHMNKKVRPIIDEKNMYSVLVHACPNRAQ